MTTGVPSNDDQGTAPRERRGWPPRPARRFDWICRWDWSDVDEDDDVMVCDDGDGLP